MATLVRLKDVGRAELGAEDYSSICDLTGMTRGPGRDAASGLQCTGCGSRGQSGNAAAFQTFSAGLKYAVAWCDTTEVIAESIRDVLVTLLQAVFWSSW